MRLRDGTGVATYASVLAATLPLAGCEAELLAGDERDGRARRWARAAFETGARDVPAAGDGVRDGGDLYRTAQVRLDMRRGLLTVRDRAAAPDVMHWTYPLPLRFAGAPNVYTVHDLIPLLHPGLTPVSRGRTARLLRRIGREAAHVVTVSEASRREIIATLGWDPARVTNTWQAVAAGAPSPAEVAAALGRLGLAPGGYLLHVGTVEPRKNVARLVEAHLASGVSAPLVLAGPDGWRAAEQLAAGGPGVVRLAWVERATLLALIRGARAVVAPSLAEGFGLAVAEAMTLGAPVLTSAGGATAEVAGGAALLVDPRDVRAIAEGLRALDGDAALRADLAGRGLARAAAFAPAAYAGRLREVYARVAGAPSAGQEGGGWLPPGRAAPRMETT